MTAAEPPADAATDPAPAEAAAEVVGLIQTLARRLRRTSVDASPWGLSPHQARGLETVYRWEQRLKDEPGIRISDLAARLHIAPRSATEVVDALEDAGLVQRRPDPRDRRAVLVGTTTAGADTATQISAQRREHSAQLLEAVPEPDQETLRTLLSRALAALECAPAVEKTGRTS